MPEDSALYPPLDPVRTGLKGNCPRCGNGKLFDGYLKLKPACAACGLDYDFADTGEGPAVFVMLIAGFVMVGLVLWFQLRYEPPVWVLVVVSAPLTVCVSLALLRWLKGVMIALQYRHNASEGRVDRGQ